MSLVSQLCMSNKYSENPAGTSVTKKFYHIWKQKRIIFSKSMIELTFACKFTNVFELHVRYFTLQNLIFTSHKRVWLFSAFNPNINGQRWVYWWLVSAVTKEQQIVEMYLQLCSSMWKSLRAPNFYCFCGKMQSQLVWVIDGHVCCYSSKKVFTPFPSSCSFGHRQ